MRRKSRVRAFPVSRLKHFDGADLSLVERSGHREWQPAVGAVASRLARSFGLGAAELEVSRVQVIKVEDLREMFPGRWVFAVLADPLAERRGFLVLDPLLCSRVLSRLQMDSTVGRGWSRLADGTSGALAWVIASALEELDQEGEHRGFGGWRFLGLSETAGEIGRANLSESALLGTWISVTAGWDQGFAAWLEPESSVSRRSAPDLDDTDLGRVEEIPLALDWLAGTSCLRLEELSELQCGDVVLLEEEDQSEVILRVGPLVVAGTQTGGRLTVSGIRLLDKGEVMNATQMPSQGNGTGLDAAELGRLPVELTAEAGRMNLSLGQLKKLQVGHVLALPVDVLGPLDLRAGGRLVARGELVEVDGQRGIRLTEMVLGAGDSNEDTA